MIALVQYVVFRIAGLDALVKTAGASNAFVGVLAFALGAIFTLLGLAVVQAVTALAMVELDEAARSARGPRTSSQRATCAALGALVRAALVVAVLDLSVVGIPVAAWLTVRWSFLAQVVALEDEQRRHALRRSGTIVKGHWLRVASIVVFVSGLGLLLGPVVGTLLLLRRARPSTSSTSHPDRSMR